MFPSWSVDLLFSKRNVKMTVGGEIAHQSYCCNISHPVHTQVAVTGLEDFTTITASILSLCSVQIFE